MKNSTEVPQKLRIESPYDPAIPFPGIYPEKNSDRKRDMHPQTSIAARLTIARHGSNLNVIERGMDKEDTVYIYTQWNIPHNEKCHLQQHECT